VKINTKFSLKSYYLILLILVTVILFFVHGFPKTETLISFALKGFPQTKNEYYKEYKYSSDSFGPAKIKYSTIAYECTDEEKLEVKPLMEMFIKVLGYTGKRADADKNVGALERFYYFSDENDYTSVKYHTEFITAKISGRNGYMWVFYSIEHLDENGKVCHGSWKIPCYFEIKKLNDEWIIIKLLEPA